MWTYTKRAVRTSRAAAGRVTGVRVASQLVALNAPSSSQAPTASHAAAHRTSSACARSTTSASSTSRAERADPDHDERSSAASLANWPRITSTGSLPNMCSSIAPWV